MYRTLEWPWLSAFLAFGLFCAIVIGRGSDPRLARKLAVVVASLFTIAGIVATILFYNVMNPTPWVDPLRVIGFHEEPLLAVDSLNALLLPFASILSLSALLATPRALMTPARIGIILWQLCAVWLLFLSEDLILVAVAWVIGLMPLLPSRHTMWSLGGHIHVPYLVLSCVLFIAGVAGIIQAGVDAQVLAPSSLLDAHGIEAYIPRWVLPAILIAVMIRKGVFPFHSWMPSLADREGTSTVALLAAPQVSLFVLIRIGLAIFPSASAEAMPWVGQIALVATLYGAVVGLGARDMRRAYGWMVVSQSSLVLVGLECANISGITGALVLWIAMGLSLTGLGLAIACIESRVNRIDLRKFYGLGVQAPILATCFLILGMASVGLPGTLGYVAEDLIAHGTLDAHPWTGIAMILATAANGFNVLRCFFRIFGGPSPEGRYVWDLLLRERLALVGLVVLLIVSGIFPGPLVDTRTSVAVQLVSDVSESHAH